MIINNNNCTRYTYNLRSVLAISFILFIALCTAHVHAQPITPPAIITTPGVYELTGDVTGIYDGYGIKIESSDVVLDGQGFSLRGSNREDVGILVNKYGTSLNNVEIKNIKLGDWGTAIRYNYVKGEESGNIVSNTQIYGSTVGVHVEYSNDVLLQDLSFTDTSSPIVVNHDSSDITIDKATITGCGIGATLEHSRGITLSNSNINTCEIYGVQAGDVRDLSISKTSISDNKYAAITLANVDDFTIESNVISRTSIGAALQLSSGVVNGLIYDNLFQSRENVVKPSAANIVWFVEKQPGTNIMGGPYLGGNYWGGAEGEDGFSDTAVDSEGYGITDMPYEIDEYNIDKYPLRKTDKTSLPSEILALYNTDEEEYTASSAPESASSISITSMPLDNETEPDMNSVAVTNLYTSQPPQAPTRAPEATGLAASALLSAQGMSFLIFTGAPDGATIWLIGDVGAEQAGVVSGGVLTVPVDPKGPFYNSYRITAPGYATFEERFKAYPSTEGMSVLISVEMAFDQGVTTPEVSEEGIPTSEPILPPEPTLPVESTTPPELLPTSTPVLDSDEPLMNTEESNENGFPDSSSIPAPFPTPVDPPYEPVLVIENPSPQEPTPTLAGTGYLSFSVNVDGATIILIDRDDEEHIAGTISQGSFVASVEIGTDLYTEYRIEKDGYGSVSGYLYDYPESNGDVRNITIVLDEMLFSIVAAAGPNGQVTPSEEVTVKPGENFTIRITPDPGYEIEVIQVDGEIIENPTFEYTFTDIQSDHVLVASFN